jgi:scyllo-inositol 2-dehydrogenase (NADP+)
MTLQAGLIGFGLAGRYFHAPLVQAAGIRIAAVVSSRTDVVHKALGNATVLPTSEALLAHDGIDLVIIASPNALHATQATAALEAGRHVVVDKPMCPTAAEAGQLSRLAARRNRMLTVFHNRRWDSDFLTLQHLVASGRLGDINAFHARWDRFRPDVADRWRERSEPGAGVLYDLGSHLIDQALVLFGRPDWVQADVFTQRPGGLVDDGFELLLGKGQLRITLGVSSLATDGGGRYRVHGSQASFLKAGLDPQESQLRGDMQPIDASFGFEPEEQWGRLVRGDGSEERIASERGQWTQFYAKVRDSIEHGAAPPVAPDDACATIEVIEAALRSSSTGRRIALDR